MFIQMPDSFKPRFNDFRLHGFFDETMREGAERCPFSIPAEDKVTLALRILKTGVRDIVFGSGPDDPENIAALAKAVELDGSITHRWSAAFILLLNCWEPIYERFMAFPEHAKKNAVISLAMLDYQKEDHLFEAVVDKFRSIGFVNFRVSLLNNFKNGVEEAPYNALVESINRSIDVGIDVVRINDSLGEIFPEALAILCANLRTKYPDVHFCLHAHDDRGLGLQNALTSVYYGFDFIESAFAGFGNRSGLPAIETLNDVLREKNIAIDGVNFSREEMLDTSRAVENTFLTLPHVYRPNSGMIVDWENMGVANIPDYVKSEREAQRFLNDVGLHPQTIISLLDNGDGTSCPENIVPHVAHHLNRTFHASYSRKREQYDKIIRRVTEFYTDGVVFEPEARRLATRALQNVGAVG